MTKHLSLGERIARLEARNQRVEANKAWEISWTRRFTIMLMTYVTVVFYLHFVIHIDPWINALVPVIGYFCSTLTISRLKKRFISKLSKS
jgi:hypothetical protein